MIRKVTPNRCQATEFLKTKAELISTQYPYRLIYLDKSELITFLMSQPWLTYFNSWVMHSNRSSGSWVI